MLEDLALFLKERRHAMLSKVAQFAERYTEAHLQRPDDERELIAIRIAEN